MTHSIEPHPLESMMGQPEDDQAHQRQTVEAALKARQTALARLDGILNAARLVHALRRFQRDHLADYHSRIISYFGTTQHYDPRRPTPDDYVLYLELQWSDWAVDFSQDETPVGCFTIPIRVLIDTETDAIGFPSIFTRCTRAEWERDPTALKGMLSQSFDQAMHARKRTTQAYRVPWGIQTVFDIEIY